MLECIMGVGFGECLLSLVSLESHLIFGAFCERDPTFKSLLEKIVPAAYGIKFLWGFEVDNEFHFPYKD